MKKRYKGCMLGLAFGDALEAPVEFLSLRQIMEKYGDGGIKDLDSWGGFAAGTYTDDT
ncbi:MAG: ADP-ribosylglycohydrolase family protein [Mahellales bacterium]|jgi:ADP-ribosylglycohydrolase